MLGVGWSITDSDGGEDEADALLGVLVIAMFLTDIGTATNQWDDKNGHDGADVCQGNFILDNRIDTQVPFTCFISLPYV